MRKMITAFLSFALLCVASANELEIAQAAYESATKKAEVTHLLTMKAISDGYKASLEAMSKAAQGAGDLDLLVRVRDEMKRLEAEDLDHLRILGQDKLAELKKKVNGAIETASLEKQTQLSTAKKAHIASLEAMQVTLTKAGKIEEALAVKRQLEEIGPSAATAGGFDADASSTYEEGMRRKARGFGAGPGLAVPAAEPAPAPAPSDAPAVYPANRQPPNYPNPNFYIKGGTRPPTFASMQKLALLRPAGVAVPYPLVVSLVRCTHEAKIARTSYTPGPSGSPYQPSRSTTQTYYSYSTFNFPRLLIKAQSRLQDLDLEVHLHYGRNGSSSPIRTQKIALGTFPGAMIVDAASNSPHFDYLTVHIVDSMQRTVYFGSTLPNQKPIVLRRAASGLAPATPTRTPSVYTPAPTAPVNPYTGNSGSIYNPYSSSRSKTVGGKATPSRKSSFSNRTRSGFNK